MREWGYEFPPGAKRASATAVCLPPVEAALSYGFSERCLTPGVFAARFFLVAMGDLKEDRPALFCHR